MELTALDVLNELKKGEPISLIRCGDGEKIVLDGFNSFGLYNSVLKRQLGFSPSISDAEKIRENLIEAINGCDILGVPRHSNLDRLSSHWQQVESTINKYCNAPEKKCHIDVHWDFLHAGYFDELLNTEVCFISCRDIETGLKRKFNLKRADKYLIAPEAKYTSYKGVPHYPDQFIRVERWMDKMDAKGKLLLVGAGFIGKIYCNWWRDRGGIAMDTGAIFDEWAGRVTRGPDRELDKIEHGKYSLYGNLQR
jgi:hypothetical protein